MIADLGFHAGMIIVTLGLVMVIAALAGIDRAKPLLIILAVLVAVAVGTVAILAANAQFRSKLNAYSTETKVGDQTKLLKKYLLMHAIVECESQGRHDGNWGDLDYPYPAFGITQAQERTFLEISGKMGLQDADWKNPEHQLAVLSYALDNGLGHRWSCYKKLMEGRQWNSKR